MRADWSDADLLEIIDMSERRGLAFSQIGARFGVSRSAVAGVVSRIKNALPERDDVAVKPANREGGMKERWWVPGLARQEQLQGMKRTGRK